MFASLRLFEAPSLIKSAISRTTAKRIRPIIQWPAPHWKGKAAINGTIEDLSLQDYAGKYLVMAFYPKDFTFVCPTELTALNDRLADFKELNTEIVGVSVDSAECHLAWNRLSRKEGGLGGIKYPLLSDHTKSISETYQVLHSQEKIAFRGTFIIDPEQKLRVMQINDLPVGRNVDEIIRLVKAIQFADKHGEVCPANWTSGGKTIKPDPEGSKEYFKSLE